MFPCQLFPVGGVGNRSDYVLAHYCGLDLDLKFGCAVVLMMDDMGYCLLPNLGVGGVGVVKGVLG